MNKIKSLGDQFLNFMFKNKFTFNYIYEFIFLGLGEIFGKIFYKNKSKPLSQPLSLPFLLLSLMSTATNVGDVTLATTQVSFGDTQTAWIAAATIVREEREKNKSSFISGNSSGLWLLMVRLSFKTSHISYGGWRSEIKEREYWGKPNLFS